MQYTVARSSAPTCYPPRVKLEPGASWDKLPDGYDPVDYTDPLVLANAEDLESGNKWADVERPALSVLCKRKSFAAGDSSPLDIALRLSRNPGRASGGGRALENSNKVKGY